jgi:hypothetical protein
MKRLEAFDLLFTDWMLGFSILLLVAIRLAPGILGEELNARQVVLPKTLDIRPQGSDEIGNVTEWEIREYCPRDNSLLVNHYCEHCKMAYPAKLVTTVSQNLLYILLILFVVKYLHERSVLRFRLYEDERGLRYLDGTHARALHGLHDRSNISRWHFGIFISRLFFLGSFYPFVITTYIQNHGRLEGWSTVLYGALLAFGYFIPDAALFKSTKGEVWAKIREWSRQGASKFRISFVEPQVLIPLLCLLGVGLLGIINHFVPRFHWLWISLVIFLGFAVLSGALYWHTHRTFDQSSIEVTAVKWLLLDIFNFFAIVWLMVISLIWTIDTTWFAALVLFVNLLDWYFGRKFYFGSQKFSIQAA